METVRGRVWGFGLGWLKNPIVHLLAVLAALAAWVLGGGPSAERGPLPHEHASRCKFCARLAGREAGRPASWESSLRAAGALE